MSAKLLRPLGHIETMMTLLHEQGGSTQGLQALRLEGRVDAEGLRRAACAMASRYEAMRCVIVQHEDAFWFAPAADGELAGVPLAVLDVPEADWPALIDHALHDAIDASRRLWRLTLVSDGRQEGVHLLLLTYHHAILDGDGVHVLLSELLEGCVHGAQGVATAGSDLCESADGVLPRANQIGAGSAVPPIAHATPAPLMARRTRYRRSRLDPSAHEALRRRCDEDGVSVNALLSACLARSAVAAGFAGKVVDFKAAVSLRECLPEDMGLPRSLGCQLAVAQTDLPVSDAPLAQDARAYQRSLMQAVMSQCLKARAFTLAPLKEMVGRLVGGNAFHGLGITNLGTIPLRTRWPGMEVTDYLPLANRVSGHHAFAVHIAVFRDALTWAFVYPAPLMDAAMLARIADDFATRLHAYIQGDPS